MTISQRLQEEFPKRAVSFSHIVYKTADGRALEDMVLYSDDSGNVFCPDLETGIKTLKHKLGMIQ